MSKEDHPFDYQSWLASKIAAYETPPKPHMNYKDYHADFDRWIARKTRPSIYPESENFKSIMKDPKVYSGDEPAKEKALLLDYLTSFQPWYAGGGYPSVQLDKVTGQEVHISLLGYSDGKFSWEEEEIYYIMEHNMPVSQEFLSHVKRQLELPEKP